MNTDPTIRRCLIDDSAKVKFHHWSVTTGKPVRWVNNHSGWDQLCPLHGGKNTVKDAISQGVPQEDAKLCVAVR